MKDLVALCEKHNVSLMLSQRDDSVFKGVFEGFSVFFTDGTPSKESTKTCVSGGENLLYPSSITVQVNRYKKS